MAGRRGRGVPFMSGYVGTPVLDHAVNLHHALHRQAKMPETESEHANNNTAAVFADCHHAKASVRTLVSD